MRVSGFRTRPDKPRVGVGEGGVGGNGRGWGGRERVVGWVVRRQTGP